ncbi:MAG: amidohydrolase family protein, partial [Sphingobium sp.]
IAILSLTAPNVYVGTRELSLMLARQVNDDFAAAQRRFPDRIRWMASLPFDFPDDALAELARAKRAGAAGICTLTNIHGVALTDKRFAPVWAAIEASGLPVFVHPTTPFIDGLGLEEFGLANTIGFTTESSLCFARMFLDGFLDRYPRMKLIACHGGGALPYLIARFDRMWEKSSSRRESAERPSAYLNRIWYDSIVYDQPTLEYLIAQVGANRVLYGSDYPFLIGDMTGILARVDALPAPQRRAVRGHNAAALFGI